MSHKSAESYSHVFRFIEENVFELDPADIITDFEAGMRKAINEVYCGVRLRGCWYHYSAALRKKFLELGMKKFTKKNKKARRIKKMMMSLPLLPAEHFMDGYTFVKQQAIKWRLFTRFKAFFTYYERYWIAQVVRFMIIPTKCL